MTHIYCKLSLQEDRWRIVTLETAEGSERTNRKIGSCPLHPESCRAEPAGHALPLIAFPALGCGSCCAEGVTDLKGQSRGVLWRQVGGRGEACILGKREELLA